jgi:OmcA/MtrC family decaheme c-type cytochrome
VGVEAYLNEYVSIGEPPCASTTAGPASATCVQKEHAMTPTAMVYARVGGGTATPRRTITANAKCNACHHDLGFHGGEARKTPEFCATCHNPKNVNEDRTSRFELDPDTGAAYSRTPESVSLMPMIHKLHAGSFLSKPYLLGSTRFSGTDPNVPNPQATMNEFAGAFPNDLADCQVCHSAGTYTLPAPGLLATRVATFTCAEDPATDANNFCGLPNSITTNWTVTEQPSIPPQTAACTSCHDSDAATAHASLMTYGGVESCDVCHGDGKSADVLTVHVPRP